jgi:hypothetical protein
MTGVYVMAGTTTNPLLVRGYVLSYDKDPHISGRSVRTSIQVGGSDLFGTQPTNSLPPLTFHYDDASPRTADGIGLPSNPISEYGFGSFGSGASVQGYAPAAEAAPAPVSLPQDSPISSTGFVDYGSGEDYSSGLDYTPGPDLSGGMDYSSGFDSTSALNMSSADGQQ